MIQRLLLAVIALMLLAPAAMAQPKPSLVITVGSVQTLRIEVSTEVDAWMTDRNYGFYPLSPGTHVLRVTLADGHQLSRGLEFWGDRVTEVDGRKYWCVALLGEPSRDEDLVMMNPEDCRRQLKLLN